MRIEFISENNYKIKVDSIFGSTVKVTFKYLEVEDGGYDSDNILRFVFLDEKGEQIKLTFEQMQSYFSKITAL